MAQLIVCHTGRNSEVLRDDVRTFTLDDGLWVALPV